MKQTIYGKEARLKLLEATKQLSDPVKITLGPKGKNVIISPLHHMSYSTKDGVTVAGEVESEDPFVNAGIKLFRQAARKTVYEAGDGTTTSTVLSNAIINELNNALNNGKSIIDLKAQMQEDLAACVSHIKALATPIVRKGNMIGTGKVVEAFDIEKIKQVATISANNDEFIGQLFADSYQVIGVNGTVLLEESPKTETYIEATAGMRNDRGFAHPDMANLDNGLCTYYDPLIWVTDKNITQNKEILPLLDASIKAKRPLLIFCAEMAGEAAATVVRNVKSKAIVCAVVQFPNWLKDNKELLRDVAIFTGSVFCSEDDGFNLDNITPENILPLLGTCEQFRATDKESIIIGANGDAELIKKRVELINSKITEGLSDYDMEQLQARKSKLTGGIAMFYAGGKTEAERTSTLSRCEDAILAVRSAIQEGYLPGGGKVYLMCALKLSDTPLARSLKAIIEQICANAEIPASFVIDQLEIADEDNWGFNAKTGEFEDLCKSGIVDSAKVVRVALENAVSIGLVFLNTDCLIVETAPDSSRASKWRIGYDPYSHEKTKVVETKSFLQRFKDWLFN
jgi:chaperonin GroEL